MKSKTSRAPLGASLIVLSSFFYASYGIWTKLMGNFFGGYTASALRSVLVVIILLPIAIVYHKLEPVKWKQNWCYLLGMVIASMFVWGPLYYAILNAGIGISLSINYASIVIGMFLFGFLFANERFTKDKIISVVLGFVGLALVFSPNTSSLGWVALGAAAFSGVACSVVNVLAKVVPYNPTQTTLAVWATSVIANGMMVFLINEKTPAYAWHIQWFYLLLFSIASVIASWTFVKGVKLIDAGAAGILGLLEIVFGVMFGILFFNEHPGTLSLIGICVTILAASIPYFRDFNIKRGTLTQKTS